MLKLIGWMEYSSQAEIEFLEIITETGNITLTGSHNVFYYKDGKATPTYAENLRPGNVIVAGSGTVSKKTYKRKLCLFFFLQKQIRNVLLFDIKPQFE